MTKPQESIPPAADVLGTIGTVAGAFKYFHSKLACLTFERTLTDRRIWHNWRRKNTDGLPGTMLMLWASCAVPFGVYAIVQKFSLALQIQPQCFGGLTLIAWGQTLYYGNNWRAWTATAATLGMVVAFAATEAILIVTLRIPYYKGVEWPMTMMAILASAMQCLGLVMPFFELAKRQGRVIGIDFWFLLIDYSGAFFSLMALVAQHTFDVLGGSMYIVAMALETGIFLSQAIWLWRVRHIRRKAKLLGMKYDEYVDAHPSKKLVRTESSETIADVEAGHAESPQLREKSASAPSKDALAESTDTDAERATTQTLAVPEKAVLSNHAGC
ncbi:hypothetical protein BU23DRAFT_279571 [Bimuria novae-zelandiae CBS 107.79]|uniref:PQ-loop-domain-containing protein n=1 Tax=Bimuria novae-zelandiae CBS 107.79 TaxID=1447943 RepID=A0A6A5UVF0_9PLEO|nr:hypothetical protein BU23DRAFT_279571 [Bimuria novae-zelandiae CBS 107.79]